MDWSDMAGKSQEKDFLKDINDWLDGPSENLKDFAPILWAIFNKYPNLDSIQNKRVLELGTGRKTALAEFFENKLGQDFFQCVSLPRFKTNLSSYCFEDINEFLERKKKKSLDIIYGRFLLEENSYHPISLLFSKQFGNMVVKGRKQEVMKKLPGSKEYLAETCRLAARALKPGGMLISMTIDRSKAACENTDNLPKQMILKKKIAIGSRMGLIIMEKG